MPRQWQLLASDRGTLTDGPSSGGLQTLETVTDTVLQEPHEKPYTRPTQAHVAGFSSSMIELKPPRKLKVIMLKLQAPQPGVAGRSGYAIRQITVLGPTTT